MTMAKKHKGTPAPQAPKERLIEGNGRVKAKSGRTTWEKK